MLVAEAEEGALVDMTDIGGVLVPMGDEEVEVHLLIGVEVPAHIDAGAPAHIVAEVSALIEGSFS